MAVCQSVSGPRVGASELAGGHCHGFFLHGNLGTFLPEEAQEKRSFAQYLEAILVCFWCVGHHLF